ncbi:MAG TPA: cyclic nucleotide-binding domain-containing protein [Spirochaetota bacterium]|nr:cyclic nucleotide-binding domain-containing protein [Spirochaetota bacterium]HRZ27404.1 cyclic nucleotide-binding domain-containing protein [Spirochaetota bacterium]HSA13731.1 cyclic nucleotide-binding domain-containing protein [Spirochaetota bacterium]
MPTVTTGTAVSTIIALGAVPLFYFIYLRHFFSYYRQEKAVPEYIKHFESLLYGVSLALAIIICAPLIEIIFPRDSLMSSAFIKAALVEKSGVLVALLLITRYYPSFSVLEGILSGISIGAGFSLVENIVYASNFGPSVIIPRLLFSAPLHLTTCGMAGYFVSAMRMSESRPGKCFRLVMALTVPTAFHGLFDSMLFTQGPRLYLSGPLVIVVVSVLELLISRAKLIPDRNSLREQSLRLEDWFLKYRQPRFERWILNSMGTAADIKVRLFRAHRNRALWPVAAALFAASAAALPFSEKISSAMGLDLGGNISVLLTSVYPASMAATLVLVGIINPDFFRFNIVRLPIIFDSILHLETGDESVISFDITPSNCFLRSFEPLGAVPIDIHFEINKIRSPRVKALPLWENHGEKGNGEPTGTIVSITGAEPGFHLFVIRYFLLRIWKGIVFNLKLPGFESIRRLFLSPVTVMQKEVMYNPGTEVFRQGESINTFYFIKKGKVEIIRKLDSGEEIVLESMEAGQIFNEMALLGDTRRTVTARCATRCVLAEAKSDNLEALITNDPDFALALVLKLLNRVDSTQNSLTQTIEYLQNLIQLKEKGSHRAGLLIAMLLGVLPKDGAVTVPAKGKTATVTGITRPDMLSYLKRIYSLEKANPDESKKTKAIEKMLDGLRIEIQKED